ncbi:hypothetical protein TNCV_719771 [Trichonephila clavipes]|nr:hypothetical protein TNCV_719771 [Trichonephila clavipes]
MLEQMFRSGVQWSVCRQNPNVNRAIPSKLSIHFIVPPIERDWRGPTSAKTLREHRQCRLDFTGGSLSLKPVVWNRMSDAPASGQIRHFVERHAAISQGVTVWEQFLGTHDHFSGPSRHYSSHMDEAYCATHAIKSPRCHLYMLGIHILRDSPIYIRI